MSAPIGTTEPDRPLESSSPQAPSDATEFATEDPEQAHAFLRATYVDHTMRIKGSQAGFHMRHTHHDAAAFSGRFSSGTLAHTMAVEHRNEPLGYLLVGQIIEGRLEREAPDATLRLAPGDAFLFSSPDQPFTVRWATITMRLTRINLDALTTLSATGDGRSPRFTGLRPCTPQHTRHLATVLDYLANDVLPNPEALSHPLIVAETTRMLAATVLNCFANTTITEPDRRDRADTTPAALRRALAFIDSHAHTPITLADIAAAARVSSRTVQLAFRRYLHTTPTAHLRRVRLNRAHHDLQADAPTHGDTITAIAHRWGFTNPSRFSTTYRNTYGHPARHTPHP